MCHAVPVVWVLYLFEKPSYEGWTSKSPLQSRNPTQGSKQANRQKDECENSCRAYFWLETRQLAEVSNRPAFSRFLLFPGLRAKLLSQCGQQHPHENVKPHPSDPLSRRKVSRAAHPASVSALRPKTGARPRLLGIASAAGNLFHEVGGKAGSPASAILSAKHPNRSRENADLVCSQSREGNSSLV